ncbi:MAG: hypothetical protein L0G96_00600 [Acinetobacter sp.]|nr:hypothetical protein [Acinetobacter sp.]
MAIEKLSEFAKDGQKNTDDLNLTDGFPVSKKPARQWFNWLFNTLITKINEIIDGKLDSDATAVAAQKLQTSRQISFSGAATGSFNFNGSKGESCVLTLANSGAEAGTYGTTLKIPVITVNAKGLITTATTQDIPTASTTVKGLVQLNNTLTSTSTSQALTAAQGKVLNDQAFGVSQSSKSVTLISGTTYTNTKNKPITIAVATNGSSSNAASITINGIQLFSTNSSGWYCCGFTVGVGESYKVTGGGISAIEFS